MKMSGGEKPSIGLNLRVTGHCNQGDRKYMEDVFSVAYQQTPDEIDLEYAFFGIFDGHGGKEAAIYAKEHLMDNITSHQSFWSDNDDHVLKAIREGFLQTQRDMQGDLENWTKTARGLPSTAGTTASIAFVRRGKIFVGHVGDSGIVLGEQDKDNPDIWLPKSLTTDHKPESEAELARIEGAGGKVVEKSGVPRVVWNRPRIGHTGPIRRSTPFDEVPFLAVARALGDLWSYNSKKDVYVVSPDPDLHVYTIDTTKHRCLILATDGAWNVISPEVAVSTIRDAEKQNEKQLLEPEAGHIWRNPSKQLVDKAFERWRAHRLRADNTSVVVVMLDPPGPPRKEVLRRQKLAEKGIGKETKKPCNNAGAPPLPPKPSTSKQKLSIISRYPNSSDPLEVKGKNLVKEKSPSASPNSIARIVQNSTTSNIEKVRVSSIQAVVLPGSKSPQVPKPSQSNLQVNEVTSSDTESPEKPSTSGSGKSSAARKSISRELAALAIDSPSRTGSRSRRSAGPSTATAAGLRAALPKPRRRGRSIDGLGHDDSDTENHDDGMTVENNGQKMVPAEKLAEAEKECEKLNNRLKALEEANKAMQASLAAQPPEARLTRASHKEEKAEKNKTPETPRVLRSQNGNVSQTPASGTKRKRGTADAAVPVKRERTSTWTAGRGKPGSAREATKTSARPARRSTGSTGPASSAAAVGPGSVGRLRRVKFLKRK